MVGAICHTVALGDPGASGQLFVMKAPSDANGGGLRILEAYATNRTTVTNSLGVGGTTFTLALHKYAAAAADRGTPVVNGTIAAAIGGTAEGWVSNAQRNFVIDDTYAFVDGGEWLVIDYAEINAGNPVGGYVNIIYAIGS